MTAGRRTRILIVDDSAVMRSLLRSVVGADHQLEVCGTAADGVAALRAMTASSGLKGAGGSSGLPPDLVLLDVEMPVMDGLATLRALRARGYAMPVIMCSSLTQRGAAVTLEALAGGASDYVTKPTGHTDRETALRALGLELLPKIHGLTQRPGARGSTRPPAPAQAMGGSKDLCARPSVLAIGVSTGGPAALEVLLPGLPQDLPVPVLVVQHMPEVFTKLLAERLHGLCRLRVQEAAEGDAVQTGTISIARGNWHLEVAAQTDGAPKLHLAQGPLENHCRPSVDVLLRSVAQVYGDGAMAVVLTGMGSDGLEGCRAIRECGGVILAQDRESSAVWGMPGAVANAGLAHKVLPISAMAVEIVGLTRGMPRAARDLRERVS